MKEFSWHKHDLEVDVRRDQRGTVRFNVKKDHRSCVLELALADTDAIGQSLAVELDGQPLIPQPLECADRACIEIVRRPDDRPPAHAPEHRCRSWDWPATDALLITAKSKRSSPLRINRWTLRCADGTDSSRDATLRLFTFWVSICLVLLGTILAVVGAWVTTDQGSQKPEVDPLEAILKRIAMPDLSEEALDLLRGIIRLSLRTVSIRDLSQLLVKIGGGSWSQGMIYFRQAYRQVEAEIKLLQDKVDSVDPPDPRDPAADPDSHQPTDLPEQTDG